MRGEKRVRLHPRMSAAKMGEFLYAQRIAASEFCKIRSFHPQHRQ